MFDLFFSFSGRVGRLRYFATAVGSVAILIAVAALGALSISWRENPVGGLLALVGLLGLVAIFATWSNLSLQARRIRDIGLDPAIVIPAHLVLQLILNVVMFGSGRFFSPVATALSLAYSATLLFWPGRGDATPDLEAIFGGVPKQATNALPAASASPIPQPRLPAPQRPGRPTKTFGRRGLA